MIQRDHEQKAGNERVRDIIVQFLASGQGMTTYELVRIVKQMTGRLYSESAISARVRDCRKDRYGKHDIKCRPIPLGGGEMRYEYYILKPQSWFDTTGRSGPQHG